MMTIAATASRRWKKPPMIQRAWLRWSLALGAAIYLALALGTTEVNWTRVWEGLPRGVKLERPQPPHVSLSTGGQKIWLPTEVRLWPSGVRPRAIPSHRPPPRSAPPRATGRSRVAHCSG